MPWDVAAITQAMVQLFTNVTIGIHAHNDCGMTVANSSIAIKNGAGLIQGIVNGVGERTSNANFCSIIPSLALHVQNVMLREMKRIDKSIPFCG